MTKGELFDILSCVDDDFEIVFWHTHDQKQFPVVWEIHKGLTVRDYCIVEKIVCLDLLD